MYKLIKDPITRAENVIFNKETNCSFTFDPDNTDYQAYLKWIAEGNTPEAAE
jgi:hypothetical protein